MLIPKDSTVVIPIWAIQNSEKHGFEDPTTYRPERYEGHPRLAPEYAGSPDFENRDKYLLIFSRPLTSQYSGRANFTPPLHIITPTALAAASVPACT